MPDRVKIGFIGCGGNANGHMRTLHNMPDVRIVATCDLVESLANRAAEQYGSKPYTDPRKMMDEEQLDALYLSIPVFAHGEPEREVISRGLPFFVEKPVARTMETAREVEVLVKEADLITCVGDQLRYSGSADLARQALADQRISMVVGKYWCGSGRGDPSRWLRQWERSGGQLVEQATHTIDIMRYLIGEVESVQSFQTNLLLSEIDCPDTYCVMLRFANGALGSLTTSWAYDPRDWSNTNILEILFEESLMRWDTGKVTVTPVPEGQEADRRQDSQSIDRVFVDAVKSKDASGIRSDYSDAVKSLAISLAANKSAQTGSAVAVDSV